MPAHDLDNATHDTGHMGVVGPYPHISYSLFMWVCTLTRRLSAWWAVLVLVSNNNSSNVLCSCFHKFLGSQSGELTWNWVILFQVWWKSKNSLFSDNSILYCIDKTYGIGSDYNNIFFYFKKMLFSKFKFNIANFTFTRNAWFLNMWIFTAS